MENDYYRNFYESALVRQLIILNLAILLIFLQKHSSKIGLFFQDYWHLSNNLSFICCSDWKSNRHPYHQTYGMWPKDEDVFKNYSSSFLLMHWIIFNGGWVVHYAILLLTEWYYCNSASFLYCRTGAHDFVFLFMILCNTRLTFPRRILCLMFVQFCFLLLSDMDLLSLLSFLSEFSFLV